MNVQEKVFLASFEQVSQIQTAANLFAQQYGSVHIYIRGEVLAMNRRIIYISEWFTIAMMNVNLNLIGVGDVNKDEENFCWVTPTRQGEIQLTTLQEARKSQKA